MNNYHWYLLSPSAAASDECVKSVNASTSYRSQHVVRTSSSAEATEHVSVSKETGLDCDERVARQRSPTTSRRAHLLALWVLLIAALSQVVCIRHVDLHEVGHRLHDERTVDPTARPQARERMSSQDQSGRLLHSQRLLRVDGMKMKPSPQVKLSAKHSSLSSQPNLHSNRELCHTSPLRHRSSECGGRNTRMSHRYAQASCIAGTHPGAVLPQS